MPAEAAAIPDSEFKSDITTGISPPPIGTTKARPVRIEIISKAIKTFWMISKLKLYIPKLLTIICRPAIAIKIRLNIRNHLEARFKKLLPPLYISESFKNAITLPLNVTPPIITVA